MGREVGVGFRMGYTCKPMADSCQCMAKLIQYCEVFFKKSQQVLIHHSFFLGVGNIAMNKTETRSLPLFCPPPSVESRRALREVLGLGQGSTQEGP